jgi:hypothetical protein
VAVLWIFAMASVFSGCKQLDKLTQFSLEYNESMVISSMIGMNLPFNIATPKIKTNSTEAFAINDTRKDLIEDIKLEALALNISDPADADFSFLQSIEIYISAEGLEEILVAWKYEIDDSSGNSLELETANEDLSSFIIQDEFTLKFTTVTDKLILSDHHVEVNARFFVDAKILGL